MNRRQMRAQEAGLAKQLDDQSYRYYMYIGYPLILIGTILFIVRLALLNSLVGTQWWIMMGVGIGVKLIGWILVIVGRVKYRRSLARLLLNHQGAFIQPPTYVIQPAQPYSNIPPPQYVAAYSNPSDPNAGGYSNLSKPH